MTQLLPDVSPLRRSGDFRLLYLGQTISDFGSALTYVVLPVQLYELTHSTAMVGLLSLAEFIPMLLIAFLGGVLADHFERRRILIACQAIMAAVLAALVTNALAARPQVAVLFASAAVLAALTAIHRPAIEAMTPQLVRPEDMAAVGALTAIRGNTALIVGPGLAGWIAVTFGSAAAFSIDAASYLCAIAVLLTMRQKEFRGGNEGISWAAVAEGWRYAMQRKDLLGTYLVDINAVFFGMPNALFPAFGDVLGKQNVGWLYSAGPVGALIVGLTSGWTGRVRRHGLAIAWAAGFWALGIIGFGLSNSLWTALACLGFAGAGDMVSGIFRMTLWNQTIPARLRGRTAAIEMLSYTTGPYLGNAEAGFAARLLGLRNSVVAGGALGLLGTVLITWALPEFRKYRADTGERVASAN